MNIPFIIAGILAVFGLIGHIVTMERWIWPKIYDVRFPATPLGSAVATKKLVRIVWHYFTVDWASTIAFLYIFMFTDLVEDPELLAKLLAARWFLYTLVYFVLAQFQWKALKENPLWVNTLLIAIFVWLGS